MDIYVQSEIGICQEFMRTKSKKEAVSVVISPLKLITSNENSIKVQTGCNMWRDCHNSSCFFSAGARKETKKVGAD